MVLSRMRVATAFLVMVLGFGGLVFAAPPVDPPPEGYGIVTSTRVVVQGDFYHDSSLTSTWVQDTNQWARGNGSDLANWNLATGGRAAEIRYRNEVRAIDGFSQFVKTFEANSHDEPNLQVSKDFGYVASGDSLISIATDRESVGLGIVANGDSMGLGNMASLCPWAAGGVLLPAVNSFIAASSSTTTTSQMVSHTDTRVTATAAPSLGHNISAQGIGTATAQMVVRLMEGSGVFDPSNTLADPQFRAVPELISETRFDEFTSASGVIEEFNVSLGWNSVIPAYQLPEPWFIVQP